jgi:DNA-binding MarR family transcriptional regulator
MSEAASRASSGSAAREAWGLLAGLVYPPPFLPIARELGLRPPAFGTLRALERPRTMSEIAEFLHCDNSNVTGIVDVLEEKGLVERRPSPEDRRVKLIAPTGEGRALRRRLMEAVEEPPEWLRRLTAADQRTLRDLLARAAEKP